MLHKEITDLILGAFYEVYNQPGTGFLESVYSNALALEFEKQGITYESEKAIEVLYKGEIVGEFRADFQVEEKVIVELKVAKSIDNSHIAQTLNYLKATGVEIGLLLNFGPKAEFKRFIKN